MGELRERDQGGEKETSRTSVVGRRVKGEALEPSRLDVFLVWDTSHLTLGNLYVSKDTSVTTSVNEDDNEFEGMTQ